MAEFTEHTLEPDDDPSHDLLFNMAGGMPFLFLCITEFTKDNGFNISMQVGGGVHDLQTIWAFLSKAQGAVESEMLDKGIVPAYLTESEINELDEDDDQE